MSRLTQIWLALVMTAGIVLAQDFRLEGPPPQSTPTLNADTVCLDRANRDACLSRTGANELQVNTGDSLRVVNGTLRVGNADGVAITEDGDGAITFTGEGNGSDEDLTINLDDTANTAALSSSTGLTTIQLPDDWTIGLGSAAGRIEFDDQGTDEVNVVGANMGIGTSTPFSDLDVQGSAAGNVTLTSGDTTLIGNDVVGTLGYRSIDADGHAGGDQDLARVNGVIVHESGGATAIDGSQDEGFELAFLTSIRQSSNALFTLSEAMRIDKDGNIGIGDTSPTERLDVTGDIGMEDILLYSATAPTVSSGFGTSPTITGGNTASFRVNVGTGGTATSGVLTMPAAPNGWNCWVQDLTSATDNDATMTVVTATTTTSVTVENQQFSDGAAVAWTASDVLMLQCGGY